MYRSLRAHFFIIKVRIFQSFKSQTKSKPWRDDARKSAWEKLLQMFLLLSHVSQ